ncbi:ectomycorrhiza-regulated esterase [Gymnopilus junonius]|uniref:Ectomycorrhiza-regulated esterase n=1 Tax=Gymnopilus junonius TaxID=109634 RepID=A0A9P5NRK2_GYMJU|nr:ectomycorrhiza-regulated esterase [Gymnopilus junonius]
MTDRVSTKLYIPHPTDPGIRICGILEQLGPGHTTVGRKIALILHGTMGHKDYLFQKRLALKFPLDSFRFDFRGNHETGGVWKQGDLAGDIIDLQAVVDYLKNHYGYVIELLIGHSRGSVVAFRWLASTEDGRKVPAFVNASARYRMPKILESPSGTIWKGHFAKQGFYMWNVTVARKQITAIITPEDVQTFCNWDTSFVWDKFPQATDVLTLHGLSDATVPPYDALIYARALSKRNPGTHTLNLMEGADHNFTGRQDEVVEAILQWWSIRERREIKTEIWIADIKGKL